MSQEDISHEELMNLLVLAGVIERCPNCDDHFDPIEGRCYECGKAYKYQAKRNECSGCYVEGYNEYVTFCATRCPGCIAQHDIVIERMVAEDRKRRRSIRLDRRTKKR